MLCAGAARAVSDTTLALLFVNLVLVAGNVAIASLNALLMRRLRRHEAELLRQIIAQTGPRVRPVDAGGSARIRA